MKWNSVGGVWPMWRLIGVVAFLVFTYLNGAKAGEFDDGAAAYDRGDYAAALQRWKPLADKGDAAAQIALGGLYADGLGVNQSYPDAAQWFKRAADQGNARAQ